MAETSVEQAPNEQTTAPEATDKRPPGRPRSERAAKADTGQGDVGESFFDSLKALTEQDWKDLYTVYLYRCEPYTDRKVTGNDNFIMKYTQPIDQQSVMEEYGSGKYLAVLNQFNPATRHSKAAYSHYFRIMNMNYPPKLPLGEWINDGRNKDWAWAKPLLEQAEAKRLQLLQTQGTTAGMDQATEMFNAAVAAVRQLRPDQSPDQQNSLAGQVIQSMEKSADRMLAMANPAQFFTMVEKMLSMNKSSDGGILPLITGQLDALRLELSEERRFNRELLTKISTPSTEPKRSLKDEILEMKEVVGIFRGGSSANSGTDWGAVALQIGGKLLDVAGGVTSAILANKGQKPAARPPVTVNANPSLPAPDAAQPVAPQDTALTEEQRQMQNLEMINNQFGWMFDMVTPYLVDMFHKSTGMHFRDWFLDEHGDFAYRQIKVMSPETIVAIFELRKQVAPPTIQQQLVQLSPPEKVSQFVLEFLSDVPADEEGDEDEEQSGSPGEAKRVKDF